jgi:hypothetical protein
MEAINLDGFGGGGFSDFSPVPNPIVPSIGETNLLNLVNSLPLQNISKALELFPVPVTFIAQAGDGDFMVENWHAGSGGLKFDVDNNKSTGQGGFDFKVDLDIQVLDEITGLALSSPNIQLNIERLGNSTFVEDVTFLAVVPFDAFNDEDASLPGAPNLFTGFTTRAVDGGEGGYLAEMQTLTFTPNLLANTDHTFTIDIETIGAANPLEFLFGHFDGNVDTGLLNATGLSTFVETNSSSVPENITIELDLFNALPNGVSNETSVGIDWGASEQANVVFQYFEEENPLAEDSISITPDFRTALAINQMPTMESIDFTLSANPTLTLSHQGSSTIDELILLHQRDDGLIITVRASDIPTEVDLIVDTDTSNITLDVNENTLDLLLQLQKDNGFFNSSSLLGFDLGFLSVAMEDAPDFTAGYDTSNQIFTLQTINPEEAIGAIEVIADDNATFVDDQFSIVTGLDLAPSWLDGITQNLTEPIHNIFSWVEDGTNGTAAVRLRQVEEATLDLGTNNLSQTFNLVTLEAIPLQAYINFGVDSNLIPNDPNEDIEITLDIDDLPAGTIAFNYEAPTTFNYSVNPAQGIDLIRAFGHINSLNFDVTLGDLPAEFAFDFNPEGGSNLTDDRGISVLAEDGMGNSDPLGVAAVRFWDTGETGIENTDGLFGENLFDAIMRVDNIPNFAGYWTMDDDTEIVFDTEDVDAFVGGVQFGVSTIVEFETYLPEANINSNHYAFLVDRLDESSEIVTKLGAGIFGIDEFNLDTSNSLNLHYDAQTARELNVEIDRRFGGAFFPAGADFDYDLMFTIDAVPQELSISTDLLSEFDYTASSEIEQISLTGTVDTTNDDVINGTNVDISFVGLPDTISFDLNPATGVTLNMSNRLEEISIHLASDNSSDANATIFNSDFQLINVNINDISPNLLIDWNMTDGDGFIVEATDTNDNPDPMGVFSAFVSSSSDSTINDEQLSPFTLDGIVQDGAVLGGIAGASRINYSEFTQTIDDRYYATQSPSVLSRLRELYADGEKLNEGEDHIIARLNNEGNIDLASLQFTGFQRASWLPSVTGGNMQFNVPTFGDHPLFVGFEDNNIFTTLQIENVPDTLEVNINITPVQGNITLDASSSAGEIDLYRGLATADGLLATNGTEATRAVMIDTPSAVNLNWDLSFPNGVANFDASNEFELLFLSQNASRRMIGGLQMEDFQAQYGVNFDPQFEAETLDEGDLVSLDLRIVEGFVGIDNSVDGELNANLAKAGIDGFFSLYNLENSPENLNTGTSPNGAEYVPVITFMMQNFRLLALNLGIDFEIFPDFAEFEFDVDPAFNGTIVFDYWAREADVSFSINDFHIGFRNDADYTDNSPIHFIPLGLPDFERIEDILITFNGFHDFADHIDPFV